MWLKKINENEKKLDLRGKIFHVLFNYLELEH